jgi:hypothetical protein
VGTARSRATPETASAINPANTNGTTQRSATALRCTKTGSCRAFTPQMRDISQVTGEVIRKATPMLNIVTAMLFMAPSSTTAGFILAWVYLFRLGPTDEYWACMDANARAFKGTYQAEEVFLAADADCERPPGLTEQAAQATLKATAVTYQ